MPPADGEQPGATGTDIKPDAGAAPGASASDILNAGPWYGEIADADLRGWVEKNNPKDAVSALKQLRDAQKMIGDNARIALPKEADDITQWEGWDKLGVPKDAAGYAEKIKRPEMPDGMTYDEGLEKSYLEHAAKLRTPAHIVQQNIDFIAQQRIAEHNALKEHANKDAAEVQALLNEWGPEKDAKLEIAKRAGKFFKLSGEEIAALDKGLLGGRTLMTALYKLGLPLKEGSVIDGDAPSVFGKEAAKAELDRVNARIAKGETLTPDEMKARAELYKRVHG